MRALLALAVLLSACAREATTSTPSDAATETGPRVVARGDAPWEKTGSAAVGHAIFVATDASRTRTLTMQVWYPSSGASGSTPLEDLVVDAEQRKVLVELLEKASSTCTRERVASLRDAPPAPNSVPLVAFSHCHGCTRFSMATIAEHLASHGFAVVAPDHAGNTLFDAQKGANAPLNREFLATRAADVRFAIDRALDGAELPAALRGKLDPTAIGVFGHSYGAATAGLVLETDARIKAGVAIAAPIENDLLPPAKMANVKVPVMFLLAQEDNSITEIGNRLIRSNFQRGNPPLWLIEVEDAGHWSFSDLCGLTPALGAGCGEARRQTDPGVSFHYLENESARALAASYVTAFFRAHLRGDTAARTWLGQKHVSGLVTTSVR